MYVKTDYITRKKSGDTLADVIVDVVKLYREFGASARILHTHDSWTVIHQRPETEAETEAREIKETKAEMVIGLLADL